MKATATRTKLTAAQLDEVCALGETDPPSALVLLWRHIGVDLSDPAVAEKSIDPTDWAIPEDQWQRVCGSFVAYDRAHSLGDIPAALMMMNVGPSGYQEA